MARARRALAEQASQVGQAAGRALLLEAAVAFAEESAEQSAAAQRARKKLDELTPREREVAALIARARSNDEIAEELVVSKRTVEKHVSYIRSKLAFTKRAEIVRWAMASGLVERPEGLSDQ